MKSSIRVGTIVLGYGVAILIASAVVAVRVATTNPADAQAAGGMYAFGESVLFVVVFGVAALVPTAGALFMLKSHPRFWTWLSAMSLVVAFTGVAAAGLYVAGHDAAPSLLATLAALSVLRILVAPLAALAFGLGALISPGRTGKVALLAATVMELGVSAYAGVTWFLPMLLHRP